MSTAPQTPRPEDPVAAARTVDRPEANAQPEAAERAAPETAGAAPSLRAPASSPGRPRQRDTASALRAAAGEWSFARVALLAAGAAVAATLAVWLVRPGGPLGGAAPLPAGLVYSSAADGHHVYRLQAPWGGRDRLRATLQTIYDAHRRASDGRPLSVVLLRRSADATPFITGDGAAIGQDVLAMAVVDPEGREAILRPQEDAPLRPVTIRW
jgi:hypothetical protein